MTPEQFASSVVEEFAREAEAYCWGCDHVHYKGADEILAEKVTAAIKAAVAAERERVAARLKEFWENYPGGSDKELMQAVCANLGVSIKGWPDI